MTSAAILVAALLGPIILLALYGFFRIQRMQDLLTPDWALLAEFGAALQAFTQRGGKDPKALEAMVVLAPDIAPLVFGFHTDAPTADASLPALSPDVLFARLEDLVHAWDDPATDPRAAQERARLDNLRGQVLGAEWLLQSEMKRLKRAEDSLNRWLYEGVAGLLLVVARPARGPAVGTRTRRRMLESDPRFQALTRTVTFAIMALGLVAGGASLFVVREILSQRLRAL